MEISQNVKQYVKLTRTRKPDVIDYIDVSLTGNQFQAASYQVFPGSLSSLTDRIDSTETYDIAQYDSFLRKKLKEGYTLNQNTAKETENA